MSLKRTGRLKRGKALRSRKQLPKMSAKRRAKLAAKGIHNPSSTIVTAPRMAAGKAKRPADTGFDKATVEAILERDGYSCARCSGALWGERGFDYSIQHRRARGAGGTQRPDTNAIHNGIALCGSGTTGCHGWVEGHRTEAEDNGWAVDQNGDPLKVAVNHAHLGPNTYLWPTGSWGSRPWREGADAWCPIPTTSS